MKHVKYLRDEGISVILIFSLSTQKRKIQDFIIKNIKHLREEGLDTEYIFTFARLEEKARNFLLAERGKELGKDFSKLKSNH